jgi:hypothetical protein
MARKDAKFASISHLQSMCLRGVNALNTFMLVKGPGSRLMSAQSGFDESGFNMVPLCHQIAYTGNNDGIVLYK